MNTNELHELARTLLAADRNAASWVWNAADDADNAGAYIDCSEPWADAHRGSYSMEVGDGEDAVVIELSLTDLKEIHQRLTVQLMVARMQDEQSRVDDRAAGASRNEASPAAGTEAAADDCDGM